MAFIHLIRYDYMSFLYFSFFFGRYGFGNAGNVKYNIPGGATLQYKIKLAAFEKVN